MKEGEPFLKPAIALLFSTISDISILQSLDNINHLLSASRSLNFELSPLSTL